MLTGLVAAVVAVVLASVAVLAYSATSAPTNVASEAALPPAAPVGPPALVGPAVLSGRVVGVGEPGTVVVEVQGQRVPVDVVGADFSTNPSCAAPGALAFARDTLAGKLVTLVPDPTLPATPRMRAYLVLRTQLSYTDAAVGGGWALPGESQYRSVYDDELRRAQDEGEGMWGPPCRRSR